MPVTADYVSNTTWPEMAERIRAADSIALTTHTRPDGDALGSVLALARALPGLGKRVDSFFVGPIESPLRTLAGVTPFRDAEREPPGDEHDLIIVTVGVPRNEVKKMLHDNVKNLYRLEHIPDTR